MIFATVPPPAAQKIAAARLLDDGGVLSWTLDLATKPLATWLILALKIRPQSAKASAGSQPLRRNELDARAISAARTLLDAKEVKRTHDGAWRPISGEAHNVTTATDVETTDRASEGR